MERGAFTAFAGDQRLAAVLADVAVAVAQSIRREPELIHHVFENDTGSLKELDLRGSDREIRGRIKAATKSKPDDAGGDENESEGRESGGASKGTEAPRGPGRPRLGVVAREVTLLPRHWDWLNDQPGGASVVLRRLVELENRVLNGIDGGGPRRAPIDLWWSWRGIARDSRKPRGPCSPETSVVSWCQRKHGPIDR